MGLSPTDSPRAHSAAARYGLSSCRGMSASRSATVSTVAWALDATQATVEQALAAGDETVEVWRAVWRHEGLPGRDR